VKATARCEALTMKLRRPRRAMSQINVVPYIDVMLVLLIIFMVTAPFMNPGLVELPSVGQTGIAPAAPLEVVVKADGGLILREREAGGSERTLMQAELLSAVQAAQRHKLRPVVISADRAVRYERVMEVMDAMQRAGVKQVGLLVQPQP
jgi:biopolymer transport protein TolR